MASTSKQWIDLAVKNSAHSIGSVAPPFERRELQATALPRQRE
jgi:hypothetical protein